MTGLAGLAEWKCVGRASSSAGFWWPLEMHCTLGTVEGGWTSDGDDRLADGRRLAVFESQSLAFVP